MSFVIATDDEFASSAAPRVFTASHANETHEGAVDGALIEQAKENIEPLKRGRNPHALLKALGVRENNVPVAAAPGGDNPSCGAAATASTPDAPVRSEATLKAERKALEAAIKSYSGSKPLDPWLAYIRWTQQSYPTAAPSSHLLPLLEKATRTFLRDESVRHTLAYLQLWFQYMDAVDDSLDMFSFLHAQGIGVKHAQLFEGWSLVLERRGRTQEAADALQLGLNSGAQPAWRLKGAKERLQARVAKSIAQAVAADPNAFAAPPAAAGTTHEQRVHAAALRLAAENGGGPVRQPLQRIGADREPITERSVNGATTYAPPPSTMSSSVVNPAARRTNTVVASSSNFQVFCDDSAPAGAASAGPAAPFASILAPAAASSVSSGPATGVWNEFASVSQSSKENRQVVSSWSEPLHGAAPAAEPLAEGSIVTLPPPLPKSISAVPVFVDAECASQLAKDKAAAASDAAAAAVGPRRRLDGPLQPSSEKAGASSLAKLAAQPLRHMLAKPATASSSSSSASASAASSAK